MCHECDDEDDGEYMEMPPDMKEDFFNFICEQMSAVIEKAESMGVLHQLITEWSKERIVQFELATVIEGRSLDEDMWRE